MSRHLERLLQIDNLLRSSTKQTSNSLAEALEVSERTIRSDIAFLRDRYSAPIEFRRAQGYHYQDKEWRLPTITLSRGELFAITLGASMLEAYAGSTYAQELRSAIARLSEQLPEQTSVDLQQLANERVVFRSGAEINLNPEVWHQLENACRIQQSVQMTYYTASRDAVSERKLDPYVLHIYRGTNPYVIGYCHKRKEIRCFRVDRIKSLQALNESFVRAPTFDARDHLELIFQHEVGSVPVDIVIWFDACTAPFIRERRWHPTQELQENPDGSVTLFMTVSGLHDLKRWVMGYGKGAVVKQPPELEELVKQEAEGMLRQYYQTKL